MGSEAGGGSEEQVLWGVAEGAGMVSWEKRRFKRTLLPSTAA